MTDHSDQKAIEMRYLLGKLPDSEVALLEQKCFTDDSVFDDIEIAEDELIDAYVRDRLSAADRKQFEKKLLSSKRIAERVEFARLLSKSGFSLPVDDEPPKPAWWTTIFNFPLVPNPAISGAVAVVFLLVLGMPGFLAWMHVRNESVRLGMERAALEQQKQKLEREFADQQLKTNELDAKLQDAKEQQDKLQRQLQELNEQLARTTPRSTVSTIASVVLLPNFSRTSGQPDELIVRPSDVTIQLKLALEADDYSSYQATIKSPGNPNFLTRQGLRARRSGQDRIILLQISSRSVSSGEYLVIVSGRTPSGTYEPVADYRVRVSKK